MALDSKGRRRFRLHARHAMANLQANKSLPPPRNWIAADAAEGLVSDASVQYPAWKIRNVSTERRR